MLAIIVGTHGHFAEELVKTSEMICGKAENLKTITLVPGEGAEDLDQKYLDAIAQMDSADGVIILNDLFGGSPYNAACRVAVHESNYGIVTGVNLPMLIEMISLQMADEKLSIQEVMQRAVDAVGAGAQTFHKSQMQVQEDELF